VVFTGNYGEAGAVDRFGPQRGLPQAFSGHNGFAAWGPPAAPASAPVVVIWEGGAPDPAIFRGCGAGEQVRTGVHDEESSLAAVYLCSGGVTGSWAQVWPRLVHLSS
jgi:hypothetical protein